MIFTKPYLDAEPDATLAMTGHDFTEPFNTLTAADHGRPSERSHPVSA